jgi:hypothetical protein
MFIIRRLPDGAEVEDLLADIFAEQRAMDHALLDSWSMGSALAQRRVRDPERPWLSKMES